MPTLSPVLTFCLLGGIFAGLLAVVFKARRRKAREKRTAACYSSPTVDCLLVLALETARDIDARDRAMVLADIAGLQAKRVFVNVVRSVQSRGYEAKKTLPDRSHR